MRTIQQARKLQPFMPAAKVQASGGGGGGGGGAHDFLGSQHILPTLAARLFLASPGAGGAPAFRSMELADFQTPADTRYALRGRMINALGGLTGTSDLTTDVNLAVGAGIGITVGADDVNVNQAYAFAWTGQQTWTLPLRAIGATGAIEIDDRTTAGAAHRWTEYANSDTLRWAFNGTDKLWLQSGGAMRSPGYVSQSTGLLTDFGTGEIDARRIYANEMHVMRFVTDVSQAMVGSLTIGKSLAELHSTFTAPAAGGTALLVVKNLPSMGAQALFQNGDFVLIQNQTRPSGLEVVVADCWGTVVLDTTYGVSGFDATTKTQRYTFTRSSGADAGSLATGATVLADATIFDYGTAGGGIYQVNAIDGASSSKSPYSRVATFATHPRTMIERTREGNITGITTRAAEYGFYAGDGGIGNANKFALISTVETRLNNLDLNIYSGGVRTFRVDAATPYLALGNPNPTSFLGGNGFWVGNASGTYKLHIGNVSAGVLTEGMSWDGSAVKVRTVGGGIEIGAGGVEVEHASGLLGRTSAAIVWGRISGATRVFFAQSDVDDLYIANTNGAPTYAVASYMRFMGASPYTVQIVGSGLDVGSPFTASVNAGDVHAGGTLHAGSTASDYTPTSGNWGTAGSTLLLNALNYSTIGFHDSGSRVDFIRVGAGIITLGYDGGFGSAAVQMPNGYAQIGAAGSGATLALFRGAAAVDNRLWDIATDNTNIYFRAINDAYTVAAAFMQATRSGTTVSSVMFPSSQVAFRGALGASSGVDEVRIGVESGVPRITLEDAGNTIAAIDNNLGALRVITPGVGVRATFDASGNFAAIGNVSGVDGVFSGNIQTNAGIPWNLGGYTGTVQVSTGYITVVVNGVGYRLLAKA